MRNCVNVKNRQTKLRDSNLETIENLIETKNLLEHKVLAIKLEEFAVDRNLSGLIANQLMAKYQRPVLILNKIVSEDGLTWEGSARGYGTSRLTDFREFVRESNLAMYAEGHPNAFGAGFTDENFNKFVEYADTVLADLNFTPCYKVDFIYPYNDFKGTDILEIASLESLWGQEIPEALVAITNIKITADNLTLMSRDKNPTLKITLPNGVACIKFKSSEEEYENLCPSSGCVVINIVGKCRENVFNGNVTPQIIISDLEVIERQQYYF